ncbi:midasin [Vararia minispora EC-137]|uniref:Midasin n=1 Tax=Vararia minispora EC-137 TaxID=1314806 RepID=A0ACB8QXL2_9AGAM|nr:midasin [Vararia minispora EC-137]
MSGTLLNPLEINLEAQFSRLQEQLPADSVQINGLQHSQSHTVFLSNLSRIMLVPSLTEPIAAFFRPLLLDLCARWLEYPELALEKFEALCLLIQAHEELFPVLSTLLRTHIPEKGPLGCVLHSPALETLDANFLQRILLAYFRLLEANRELPSLLLWPLDPLSSLIWSRHPNNAVRLMAVWCYALQSGMGEAERDKLLAEVVGPIFSTECLLNVGHDVHGSIMTIDGWLIVAHEASRVHQTRTAISGDVQDFYGGRTHDPIRQSELCPFVVDIYGVLMLRQPVDHSHPPPSLIPTQTSIFALRSLSLRLSLRLPTLISSPPSSGKTLVLSHLAGTLYPGVVNQIITIPLADTSLDPRSLLGSYVSSPTSPGTFEWREGILVRAMRAGRWVVFKDIDRGSIEVLGTIKPLVESLGPSKRIGGRARILVPGHGEVVAAESFAIFATRSLQSSSSAAFPGPTFFGAHKFSEVVLRTPSLDELRVIVDSRFPKLAGAAAEGCIRLWSALKALGTTASSRTVGLRELDKFCARIEHLLPMNFSPSSAASSEAPVWLSAVFANPSVREDIFCEARDVFFGAGTLTTAAQAYTQKMASLTTEHLALSGEQRDWLMRGRAPDFKIESDVNGRTTALCIGRVRLLAAPTKLEVLPPTLRPFAMHRPAVSLMARIASAISLGEPVLLTGETGTGKTSIVSHMAGLLRRPLVALNLSQQTESADLLGGFKPIDARVPGAALQEHFLELFRATFSQKRNAQFQESTSKAVREGNWKRAAGLWKESARMAKDRLGNRLGDVNITQNNELDSQAPRKRRKTEDLTVSLGKWRSFEESVVQFEVQHIQNKGKFAFGFVEGPLVKALRSGDWILLDEINLASPETLEAVSGLLQSPISSITVTEKGELELIPRHSDFRLFACMNPATDVGKKDLPPNIRSRFTEIDVPPPDADRETLLSIIMQYVGRVAVGDKAAIMDVADFYTSVKRLADSRQISDGANHRPHFSMRTLVRALVFAADIASSFSLRRALWEGCLMTFTMVLDAPSAEVVAALAEKHILSGVRNIPSLLSKEPSPPGNRLAEDFVKLGPFYLERGPAPIDYGEAYVLTPSVKRKLVDLARIILTRRFPVLIEGPTSSGKTSSIEYLAKQTGHRFVRINNHEHTDIQEYLGTYVSDLQTGKLVFKDGLLVQALRNGDWIVLDELNLAPTDVLEALNRLLDDNRELVIPETQEVVRPHPHFMLFATQNPPGLYAGRKVLSRAFRNRFLEVHFEDVPQAELEMILHERCRIAPSYAQRIVAVFRELQVRRQSSRVFESKHGFATLRDLFRWAGRDAVGYQELAENGYMLLAERVRREDDRLVVKDVIETVMKVRIDERALYDFERLAPHFASYLAFERPADAPLVWTKAMQRLLVLIGRALRFNEPVLLVGETGTGKTSVCQLYADAVGRRLHAVNCHQNTETADLIGGLRPVRSRAALEAEALQEAAGVLSAGGARDVPSDLDALAAALDRVFKALPTLSTRAAEARSKIQRLAAIFGWHDGPLVEAMRSGDILLLDEISLADDSVLERLNSVLEPARTVVLAERGGGDAEDVSIRAAPGFQLIATMNPGGDYGKKELSPALRNRFTEIWVPAVEDRTDLEQIVLASWKHDALRHYTGPLLDFCEWFGNHVSKRGLLGLRDILAWVAFSNSAVEAQELRSMSTEEIFHHGARLICLDGLGSLPVLSSYSSDALNRLRKETLSKLQELVPFASHSSRSNLTIDQLEQSVRIGPFVVPRGSSRQVVSGYNFEAPTTRDNAMRVARACQLSKPILLEGSPGVGKTSLVVALAKLCGYHLCRINLSDQTDLSDLFGTDLPVEGGKPGEFAWKDAEFLTAMQEGHWVILDEMNLAPQAVLEGLNAVLDHRGTVFIPELGRSFSRHPSFRIFAAQNPIAQGGGRKGLPKSFVNRFTKVYVESLTPKDLRLISRHMFPDYPEEWLAAMIDYNAQLQEEVAVHKSFGRAGSPWEFNLRDLSRWGAVLRVRDSSLHPVEHLRSIYLSRFRTDEDRVAAATLFFGAFGAQAAQVLQTPHYAITPQYLQIGHFVHARANFSPMSSPSLLQSHLPWIEAMGVALQRQWLVIVTGGQDTGKTSLVRLFAKLAGSPLHEVPINNATDASDLLGSFEQVDRQSRCLSLLRQVMDLASRYLRTGHGSRHSLPEVQQIRRVVSGTTSLDSTSLEVAIALLDQLDSIYDSTIRVRQALSAELAASGAESRFEWVDGPLVRAMKDGYWLLLDNANLCSPSVLDRLNALCEPSGVLTLNEQGIVNGVVPVVKPHLDFRLIMCVDPQHGELSRAMRNRGIEIVLTGAHSDEDRARMLHSMRIPRCFPGEACGFEIRRRGLAIPSGPTDTSRWPSGLLDSDSASSVSKDLALALSHPSGFTPPLAPILFAFRSLVPALSANTRRLLDSSCAHNQVQAVLEVLQKNQGICDKIEVLRLAFGSVWPVPSDFLSHEPMDFFAKFTASSCYSASSNGHARLPLLLAIEVFVRYAEQEHRGPSAKFLSAVKPSTVSEDILSREIVAETGRIADVTRDIAREILASLPEDPATIPTIELNVLFELQRLSTFLIRSVTDDVNISVVQSIVKWLTALLNGSSNTFALLREIVEALSLLVTPSSGLGLSEIWAAMRHGGTMLPLPQDVGERNGHQLTRHATSLKREALSLMAIMSLSQDDTTRLSSENALRDVLQSLPDELYDGSFAQVHASEKAALLVMELDAVLRVHVSSSRSELGAIEEVLRLACDNPTADLPRLVPYRVATWKLREGQLDAAEIVSVHRSWHEALWTVSETGGPSILLQATQLFALIHLCDWSDVNMITLENYGQSLDRQVGVLLYRADRSSRAEQLFALYRNAVALLKSCFTRDLDQKSLQSLRRRDVDSATERVHPAIVQALSRLGTSANALPGSEVQNTFIAVGQLFIEFFFAFMELYVPNTPLDPSAAQRTEEEFWTNEEASLLAQRTLHRELERLTTGNSSNGVIAYLDTEELIVHNHIRNLAPTSRGTHRTLSRLRDYWAEVTQFLSQVVSSARLQQLATLLQTNVESALALEQVIQDSLHGFAQRMAVAYTEFDDINGPLQFALSQLRFGLRLSIHGHKLHERSDITSIASDLVLFPTIHAAHAVLALPASDILAPDVSALEILLLQLTGLAIERDAGVRLASQISQLDVVFDQALRLWSIDQSRQLEEEKAAQSLYRSKLAESEAVNDSEIEADEFLALFPDYEKALGDEELASKTTTAPSRHVTPSHIQLIHEIHLHLFLPTLSSSKFDLLQSFSRLRNLLMQRLLSAHHAILPDVLDKQSFSFMLSTLHQRVYTLKNHARIHSRPYDFYIDANVPEVRKAVVIIQGMASRLRSIIQEWPEQMVLRHLLLRCDHVLHLSVHSPVAKILAATEQLLLQSEDWEMYANKENSLKEHRQAMTGLIVEWRKLELSSWQGLLETQAAFFEEAISEWWFHMYNASIRGLVDVLHTERDVDDFLDGLVPLIDSFISSSPVGQFAHRIQLLDSFVSWIALLMSIKPPTEAVSLQRVLFVLATTSSYYRQFLPRVLSSLTSQREALEKEIKDFIKLASWKDINVQALKASAKRTHVQLYKCIRKFREILRQPALPFLQTQQATFSDTSSSVDAPPPAIFVAPSSYCDQNAASNGPAHLRDLSRTFRRFDALIHSSVDAYMDRRPQTLLLDLARQVITTANSLASEALPVDERREKYAKALLVRKRKAWSDLLKELKRIGLAYNVQPSTQERQRSLRWIREQPTLPISDDVLPGIDALEQYFIKFSGLMPQLRASLSRHHTDLTTRELQRGATLLESGLTFAMDLRTQLSTSLQHFCKLRGMTNRMQYFYGPTKVMAFGRVALENVMSVHDCLSRTTHALEDVLKHVRMLEELSSLSSSDLFFAEWQSLLDESREAGNTLSAVIDRVCGSQTAVLLQDEYETVIVATCTIKKISERLDAWLAQEHPVGPILAPVRDWLKTLPATLPPLSKIEPTSQNTDHLIDALLVSVQSLISSIKEPDTDKPDSGEDDYVRNTSAFLSRVTDLLHLDSIVGKLGAVFEQLALCSSHDLLRNTARLLPFLRRYESLVHRYLATTVSWTAGLFRLEYVVCSIMLTVATKGFCKPSDNEDDSDNGENGEVTGGVGLGEGAGAQDVSKEIEDESQVEGLQGEQERQQDRRRQKGEDDGKDAIEMGQDFEGSLEDMPDDGIEEEKGEAKDEGEGGPEEQVRDIDPLDPSAVDEKMWGDEKGPEGKDDEGKTHEDRSKEAGADPEIVAKEREGPKKEGEEGGREEHELPSVQPEEPMQEDGGESGVEGSEPVVEGAPLDDSIQDANTLDLPDDLDLGREEQGHGGSEEDMDDPDQEEDAEPGEQTIDGDGPIPDGSDTMDESTDSNQPDQANTNERQADSEVEDGIGDERDGAVAAEPDIQAGDQGISNAANADSIDSEARESAPQNQSTLTRGGGAQNAGQGADAPDEDGTMRDTETPVTPGQPPSRQAEGTDVGTTTVGLRQGTTASQDALPSELQSNPLRSLGDALQEIRQRFDEILQRAGGEDWRAPNSVDVSAQTPQLEYLQPDDEDQNIRALGPAGTEEAARLQDLKIVHEETDEQLADGARSMSIDVVSPPLSAPPTQIASLLSPLIAQSLQPGVEDALTQHQIRSKGFSIAPDVEMEESAAKREDDFKEVLPEDVVETELRHWQAEGHPAQGVENLWRLYESLTHDLSYALCEQLRLILEPTQATRLRGDYRTGKRLNMKKIIPYIASEYTKNKIWLRRTRPSQREYQILLALDDSKSMAESHSVHLAYQTLALVSKALARLEVGEIGIARFGEVVEMLHGFDSGPFTDATGARVMGTFGFSQRATDVRALVENSLTILEEARERRASVSTSAAELWQLEIIISDGICQDHDKLRTLLRKAEEQRVMVVFVVIDSLHANAGVAGGGAANGAAENSILSMKQVAYKNVEGKLELQMQRYLDSFPFEYYVVLRNVEALPEVLAGTLKQFFERISGD